MNQFWTKNFSGKRKKNSIGNTLWKSNFEKNREISISLRVSKIPQDVFTNLFSSEGKSCVLQHCALHSVENREILSP